MNIFRVSLVFVVLYTWTDSNVAVRTAMYDLTVKADLKNWFISCSVSRHMK